MNHAPRGSGMNMRPQGQPDAPGYSPQRDLAYVYPELMRTAFRLLDDCNWTPDLRMRMEQTATTEEDLSIGVERFVKSLDLFLRDPAIKSPVDAYKATGFDAVPRVVQQVMFETFGAVLTGGWFTAVRDVTLRGKMSDAAELTAAMQAAGMIVAASLYSAATGDDASHLLNYGRYDASIGTVEAIAMRDAALKALKQSQDLLQESNTAVYNINEHVLALRKKYDDVCDREQAIRAETRTWVAAPFVSRLLLGAKIFMKIIFKREVLNVANSTEGKVECDSECVSPTN